MRVCSVGVRACMPRCAQGACAARAGARQAVARCGVCGKAGRRWQACRVCAVARGNWLVRVCARAYASVPVACSARLYSVEIGGRHEVPPQRRNTAAVWRCPRQRCRVGAMSRAFDRWGQTRQQTRGLSHAPAARRVRRQRVNAVRVQQT